MAATLEENLVPFSSSFISIKLLHHVQSSNLLIIPHVKPELGSLNISIIWNNIFKWAEIYADKHFCAAFLFLEEVAVWYIGYTNVRKQRYKKWI